MNNPVIIDSIVAPTARQKRVSRCGETEKLVHRFITTRIGKMSDENLKIWTDYYYDFAMRRFLASQVVARVFELEDAEVKAARLYVQSLG